MNKIFRLFICILLALSILMPSMLCMGVSEPAVISVEKVVVDKDELNDTVKVGVSIANNPGIAGMQFQLSYDSGIVLTGVEKGDALPGLDIATALTLESPVKIGLDGLDEDSTNGVFAILTFSVPKTVSSYSIAITEIDEIYDYYLDDVPVKLENGYIAVDTAKPDIDNDGEITPDDVYIIVEAIAGNNASGSNITNADFNDDKKITMSDLNSFMKLLKSLIKLFIE